jgi:SNF2 family DNA or RNA helicase
MSQLQDIAQRLREAASELAKRCDGAREKDDQGFNAVDTAFGKELARRPAEKWTEGTVVTAYRMLKKYKKQLTDYGVEFEEIRRPAEVGLGVEGIAPNAERPEWWKNGGRPSREVQKEKGSICLRFGYDEALVEEIKERGRGRAFDPTRKAWVLHDNPTNAALTLELALREGWSIGVGVKEELEAEASKERPTTEDADDKTTPRRMVLEDGGVARVSFEYDSEIVAAVKRRTAPRRYDEESTDWFVDLNERNAFVLLEVAAEHGFELENDLEQRLETLADGMWSERQARWNEDKAVVELAFPPVDGLVSALKRLNGRVFIPEKKGGPHWEVPMSLSNATRLMELLGSRRFQVGNEVIEAMERFAQKAERRLRLSTATSGEGRLDVEDELGYDLYGYQRAGVRYAQEAERLIIGDQMGLGKTISALATVHSQKAYPVLVICPSTVKTNWVREAYRCLPVEDDGLTMSLLDGMDPDDKDVMQVRVTEKGKREEIVVPTNALEADLMVANYAILGPYVDRLVDRGMETVIVDESHKVKNPDAQRSQHSEAVMREARFRILLTGTPIRNRPKEIFNQLRLLGRTGEGSTFGTFFPWAKRYCDATQTQWGWDFSGASNIEELHRELRATCYVRREKDEVRGDLPDIREDEVHIDIDNRDEYRRAAGDVLSYVRERMKKDDQYFDRVARYMGWDEEDPRDMEDLIEEKVRRSKRGRHLVEVSVLREIAARGKQDRIVEWATDVLEAGEKLVLFAIHVPMQEALMEGLEAYEPAHIFAEDPMDERERQIDRFREEEECRVLVASLGAAKEGVDGLQDVSSIVGFAELPWSPADLDQATARLHRIGQEANMVNAYHLIAPDTVDEHIYSLVQEKRGVVGDVTEGGEGSSGMLQALRRRIGETAADEQDDGSASVRETSADRSVRDDERTNRSDEESKASETGDSNNGEDGQLDLPL